MKQPEHLLQVACVRFFRYQYPHLRKNLFSVPNGGYRAYSTGKYLKAEGQTSGISDLILLYPNSEYHGLCLEMKVKPNRPSPAQVDWMEHVSKHGYKTAICYTFDEFKQTIEEYLKPI